MGAGTKSEPQDLTNRTVAGCRCLTKVAMGGCGAIWKAKGPAGVVAVKIMHRELLDNRDLRASFLSEFKLGKDFDHPGLLKYFACETYQDCPVIVMEYFNGATLRNWLRSEHIGRIVAGCAAIIINVAEALDYVHSRGIVHCDLKPENILVNEAGEVKLIDFSVCVSGLSKWISFMRKAAGSPSYMAPEQIQKQAISPATDLYALGGVLYEILAGRPPYVADDQDQLIKKKLTTEPKPLVKFCPGVTPELDRLVQSLLAKAPADRPGTARHFLARFKKAGVFREH